MHILSDCALTALRRCVPAAISLIIGKPEARGLLQSTLAIVCQQARRPTPRLVGEEAVRRSTGAPLALAPSATTIPPTKPRACGVCARGTM